MKRIFITISAFVYIITSTGAVINMHYCMNKFAGWGLGNNNSRTCIKCGMEEKQGCDKGCCNDKYIFIKNNTAQKVVELAFQFIHAFAIVLPVNFLRKPVNEFSLTTKRNPLCPHPPLNNRSAIYICDCSLLI